MSLTLNFTVTTGLKKVSFHSSTKEGQCQRMFNYHTVALISHASKVMLKILQARYQQYVNQELPEIQAGFRKRQRNPNQSTNILWIIEKAKEFQKIIYLCFIDCAKALTVWITTNWEILKRDGNTRPPDLPPEKSVCRSRSNS